MYILYIHKYILLQALTSTFFKGSSVNGSRKSRQISLCSLSYWTFSFILEIANKENKNCEKKKKVAFPAVEVVFSIKKHIALHTRLI